MSDLRAGHDYYRRLRVAAALTVVTGVVLVALAAFVLSYAGIHALVLAAGTPAHLAGLYPLIFDAMLVAACIAAFALRESAWWARSFAWACVLTLLAAMALTDAAHAAGASVPHRPGAVVIAALPWVLVLLGLGLCLSMARHLRPLHPPAAGAVDATRDGLGQEPASRHGEPAGLAAGPEDPGVRLLPQGRGARAAEPGPDLPEIRLLPPQPRPASEDGEPEP